MIFRLAELNTAKINTDVCIIGCGAIGICLARELAGTGLRVLVLEAGELAVCDRQQKLFETHVDGLPYDAGTSRFRVLGGSTERWGGQALPLEPVDFEKREWVQHSGWDIPYSEVAQYFTRVEAYMGVEAPPFEQDLHEIVGVQKRFNPDIIHYHYTKMAKEPRMAVRHHALLKEHEDVTVLWDANVTDLHVNECTGEVTEAQVCTLDGKHLRVGATTFVLAAGALESARLLLACRAQREQGLGNEHDLVGRFLQDHPGLWVGEVKTHRPHLLCRYGGLVRMHGMECLKRLSSAAALQEKEKLLNASATVLFEFDDHDPLLKLRNEIRACRSQRLGWRQQALVAARLLRPSHFMRLARGAWFQKRSGSNWNYGTRFVLAMGCEQEPDAESRVTLAEDYDALGLPKLRVRWTVSPAVIRTLRCFSKVVAGELERLGLGTTVFYPSLDMQAEDGGTLQVLANSHHMGTTRMSAEASCGVVDTECRVHSLQNVFVAGAAVFPTSGHSNPTFTALALTIRLAETLKKRHSKVARL